MIFSKDFKEGINYVQDLFEDICRIQISKSSNSSLLRLTTNQSLNSFTAKGDGSTLNFEEFDKNFKKIK